MRSGALSVASPLTSPTSVPSRTASDVGIGLASFMRSFWTTAMPDGRPSSEAERRLLRPGLSRPSVVVRPDDLIAFELGEGHKGDDAPSVDVGARDRHLTVGTMGLDHLENALGARRADRN